MDTYIDIYIDIFQYNVSIFLHSLNQTMLCYCVEKEYIAAQHQLSPVVLLINIVSP